MGANKTFDPVTTQALLTAYDEASADHQRISALVESSRSNLSSVWGGGAATSFDSSIQEWMIGFNQVREALLSISDEMAICAQSTTDMEDDNMVTARTSSLEMTPSWT